MEDKRFSHIATDPKFRRIPKNERKVKIDKRFQGMFNDKKFKVKYTVDKRGRPVNQTSTEDLKRYYDLSSEDEDEESSSEEKEEVSDPGKYVKPLKTSEDSSELDVKLKSDPKIPKSIKKKLSNLKVDYARGEASLLSESSSDDDESEEDELSESEEIDHKWGELDNDADSTEEATSRLAACNMDWDRMRATDLMVLLNSFVPPGGAIKSVIIYPSEYGKKRMLEEEVKGPIELVETKENEEGEDTEEGSKYHMEKLRQYQLNRLKYFYAVISCDSANTANCIYTECDGMEYESSSTKIDLRFIPDDMSFEEEPKEVCEKLPELNKYTPRFFTTTALQQAKVDLTWDETDPDRIELTQKLSSGRIEDISKNDLQNYLAGSSSDEEDSAENESERNSDSENENSNSNPIDKYKLLLQEIENKESERKNKEVEMEVSWGIDLKDKTERLVKKKLEEKQEKTPFEQYLDKRKEKRKEKRKSKKNEEESDVPSDIDMNDSYFAEEFQSEEFSKKKNKAKKKSDDESGEVVDSALELLLMNEEDEGKAHFSLKKIQAQENASKNKKKNKSKTVEEGVDDFKVNVDDDRFSALFTSHLYNIDPTDPHYKKTRAMETLISEKFKRRTDAEEPTAKKSKTESEIGKNKKDAELSVLVKSVKRKTQALQNSKKNK